LEELVKEKMLPLIRENENSLSISLDELKKMPQAMLLLYHYIQAFGFNLSQTQQILKQNHQNGKTFTTNNYKAFIYQPYLTILKKDTPNNFKPYYVIEENTLELLEPIHLVFNTLTFNESIKIPNQSHVAFIDFARLSFPLSIRKWKKGDVFYPLGMNKRKKKISDFLIDQKIPLYEKENIWVLENKGDIVWIIGYRLDNRYKITSDTKQIWCIEWKK